MSRPMKPDRADVAVQNCCYRLSAAFDSGDAGPSEPDQDT